jgi:hypothetical protein
MISLFSKLAAHKNHARIRQTLKIKRALKVGQTTAFRTRVIKVLGCNQVSVDASRITVRFGKQIRHLLISYVIFFLLIFALPNRNHRHDFDRAFAAWRKSPNSTTEAELRHQQNLNLFEQARFSAAAAMVVVLIGSGLYLAGRVSVRYVKKVSDHQFEI